MYCQVYHVLVHSNKAEVKQTLALSLHEVASILGTKIIEEELVSVFEEMIQVHYCLHIFLLLLYSIISELLY
jgi:hypothetical protein